MTTYYEKPNTREILIEEERGKTAKITWTKVPADEWEDLARGQIGGAFIDDAALKCVRTRVKYIGGPNTSGRYDYCELTAEYADPDYDPRQYSWQQKEEKRGINIQFGVEWVSIPDHKLKWTDADGAEIPQNVSIPVGAVYITLRREKYLLPFDILAACAGTINEYTVLIERGSFAAGTLRFDSADSEEYGNKWYITYQFAYSRHGWNNLPKTDGADITWTVTYPTLYESTDFDKLL